MKKIPRNGGIKEEERERKKEGRREGDREGGRQGEKGNTVPDLREPQASRTQDALSLFWRPGTMERWRGTGGAVWTRYFVSFLGKMTALGSTFAFNIYLAQLQIVLCFDLKKKWLIITQKWAQSFRRVCLHQRNYGSRLRFTGPGCCEQLFWGAVCKPWHKLLSWQSSQPFHLMVFYLLLVVSSQLP